VSEPARLSVFVISMVKEPDSRVDVSKSPVVIFLIDDS
jgi:hypothetical protein